LSTIDTVGVDAVSYLDVPRLAFAGYFQADVSTINNVARNGKGKR
jgi:hypothetical protein